MEKIKSLEDLGIELDDLQKGQRIGITAKVKQISINEKPMDFKYPILIIGDFDGKTKDSILLSNYVHKYVDIRISTSVSYDIGEVLNLIYDKSEKALQYSFNLKNFQDAKYFMLPRSK